MECFICQREITENHLRRIMAVNGKIYEMCPYDTNKPDCLFQFMKIERFLPRGGDINS